LKLNLVLAESALELVPLEVRNDPSVVSDAKRRGAEASRILLDRSFHHRAMLRLKDGPKRGRPDLVHVALLSITGTPLYMDGAVRVYVHTCANEVLEIQEKTRVPKSYFRFRGLVEKLLSQMSDEGQVKAYESGLGELLRKTVSPDRIYGLSVQGRQARLEELAEMVVAAENPCVLVGGFPHGHFARETLEVMDDLARINDRPLEAHVVVAKMVYEVEKAAERINH